MVDNSFINDIKIFTMLYSNKFFLFCIHINSNINYISIFIIFKVIYIVFILSILFVLFFLLLDNLLISFIISKSILACIFLFIGYNNNNFNNFNIKKILNIKK